MWNDKYGCFQSTRVDNGVTKPSLIPLHSMRRDSHRFLDARIRSGEINLRD